MLLLQSNVEPNISAFSHVYRPHNYNEAPFLTIGMEALVHNRPNRRGNFAELCSKGYVLGTAFEHFQSQIMWMKYTRDTRISATVFHKHKYITNAGITPEDQVISAGGK